jgi:hypothetical protein
MSMKTYRIEVFDTVQRRAFVDIDIFVDLGTGMRLLVDGKLSPINVHLPTLLEPSVSITDEQKKVIEDEAYRFGDLEWDVMEPYEFFIGKVKDITL